MFRTLLIVVLLAGCSTKIIPETSNQFQVVGYAQLTQVTTEVRDACAEKLIDKALCVDLYGKIKTTAELIDSNQNSGRAADLINYIRSKL